jgi:hypothetical protein
MKAQKTLVILLITTIQFQSKTFGASQTTRSHNVFKNSSSDGGRQNIVQIKQNTAQKIDPLPMVISDVIRTIFITTHIKFDFIIYGESTPLIKEIINKVAKSISLDVSVSIKHITNIEAWNHELSQSAIILTKSKENLRTLHSITNGMRSQDSKLTNTGAESLKFVLFIEEVTNIKTIKEVEQFTMSFAVIDMQFFEFFIINAETSIDLIAKVLYTQQKCRTFTFKLLNRFNKNSQAWTKKLMNFEHYDNFHGCLLNFVVSFNNLFYAKELRGYLTEKNNYEEYKAAIANKNITFQGLLHELIQEIGKQGNFTPHFTVMLPKGMSAELIATNNLFHTNFEIFKIGSKFKFTDVDTSAHFIVPYSSISCYYLVSQNDLYNNYEKLLLAFDRTTWILLIVSLLVTLGAIFCLKLSPVSIQTIVFGAGEEMFTDKFTLLT